MKEVEVSIKCRKCRRWNQVIIEDCHLNFKTLSFTCGYCKHTQYEDMDNLKKRFNLFLTLEPKGNGQAYTS